MRQSVILPSTVCDRGEKLNGIISVGINSLRCVKRKLLNIGRCEITINRRKKKKHCVCTKETDGIFARERNTPCKRTRYLFHRC